MTTGGRFAGCPSCSAARLESAKQIPAGTTSPVSKRVRIVRQFHWLIFMAGILESVRLAGEAKNVSRHTRSLLFTSATRSSASSMVAQIQRTLPSDRERSSKQRGLRRSGKADKTGEAVLFHEADHATRN